MTNNHIQSGQAKPLEPLAGEALRNKAEAMAREHASPWPEQETVMLGAVVQDVVKMIRASLPSTIEIRQRINREQCPVLADPTQMLQVMMNLCTNAAHAMIAQGGVLEIAMDILTLDTEQCRAMEGIAPGQYVELSISDTGHGIAPDIINRVFEPYFTTKKSGEGTGLGLSVTLGIVKSHNGAIRVTSSQDQGTTFRVYIPHVLREEIKPGETPSVATPPVPVSPGKGVVLFVEDEVIIAMGVQMSLKQCGYEVVYRMTGKQALEAFSKTPGYFDVLVTDMTMPEMTGDALSREVKKIRPDIPVILCTGMLEDSEETILSSYGVDAFVQKPYDRQTLINAIEKLIHTG